MLLALSAAIPLYYVWNLHSQRLRRLEHQMGVDEAMRNYRVPMGIPKGNTPYTRIMRTDELNQSYGVSRAPVTYTLDELCAKMRDRIVMVNGPRGSMHGFLVGGSLLVVPRHVMVANVDSSQFVPATDQDIVPGGLSVVRGDASFEIRNAHERTFEFKNHDLVVVHVPEIPPLPSKWDFTKFLPMHEPRLGTLLDNACLVRLDGREISRQPPVLVPHPGGAVGVNQWRYEAQTSNGDCGLPIVGQNASTFFIAGFHTLRMGTGSVFADFLTREELQRAIDHFSGYGATLELQIDTAQLTGNPLPLTTHPYPFKKSSIDAVLRFTDHLPDVLCFGTLPTLGGATMKSNCVNTFFRKHDEVIELEKSLGTFPYFTAPTFSGKMEGDKWVDPHVVSLSACSNVCGKRSIWDRAVDDYLDGAAELGANSAMSPLDDYSAFFGVGETVVGGTNMSSSMGLPFQCKKSDLIRVDHGVIPPTVDFPDGFIEQIRTIERTIREGHLYSPVCNHVLKDEVISVVKNDMHKVRVFNILPFAFNHVMKKYLAPIVAFMRTHSHFFESAVGMDITCLEEGGRLAEWLEAYDHVLAFDKSSFDARCSTEEHIAVCRVFKNLALCCGYSVDDSDFVFRLCLSSIYPLRSVKGDLFMISYSMPSGFWMTIHFNCVRSSLQSRYAWFALKNNPPPFRTCVRQMTLGDDVIATVHPRETWFNQVSIQETLATVGAVVTSCRKEKQLVPYEKMSEVQFLKRSLRRVGPHAVWALEEKTLIKMLCMRRKSSAISDMDAHAIILDNILREAWMWGRERYAFWRRIVAILADKHHLTSSRLYRPRDFVECVQAYVTGERRSWFPTVDPSLDDLDFRYPQNEEQNTPSIKANLI